MAAPYHHGSLRSALLVEGRAVLAEQGAAGLSLRELARRTGVSHAAPARHFADREALLDALAADGFAELTSALAAAASAGDPATQLASYARAHVAFAVDNPRLLELMFSRELAPDGAGEVAWAAGRFFALGAQMLGEPGPGASAPPGPLPYVLAGALEGISALVTSGRLPREQVDAVLATAVRLLLPAVSDQLAQRAERSAPELPAP